MRLFAFYLLLLATVTWLVIWPYWALLGSLSGLLSY